MYIHPDIFILAHMTVNLCALAKRHQGLDNVSSTALHNMGFSCPDIAQFGLVAKLRAAKILKREAGLPA